MATLIINTKKILENINKLDEYFSKQNIKWTLVTKILCGYKPALEKIICSDVIKKLHSVADSRISNLETIKKIDPNIQTMYIKPPSINSVTRLVQNADISVNTSLQALQALNEESKKQGKKHKVIIMIELGELREGIQREEILKFYEKAFSLKNIKVIGIGTNLGCMHGVEPTYDKLIQLALYKQLIELKFDRKMEILSGGSSITLPILLRKKVPGEVNHFRIGETAFFGISLETGKKFKSLSTATFDFCSNIIELEKKFTIPDGNLSDANIGLTAKIETEDHNSPSKKIYRCIVDFGQLDVDVNGLEPKDENVEFAGTTSDMTVYNVGEEKKNLKVGGKIHFRPNYIATARIMNSRYISKTVK